MDNLEISAFYEGTCGICGQKRGKCIETRDAGNFVIPVWKFGDDCITHEIPNVPIRVTVKAVISPNCTMRIIKVNENAGH